MITHNGHKPAQGQRPGLSLQGGGKWWGPQWVLIWLSYLCHLTFLQNHFSCLPVFEWETWDVKCARRHQGESVDTTSALKAGSCFGYNKFPCMLKSSGDNFFKHQSGVKQALGTPVPSDPLAFLKDPQLVHNRGLLCSLWSLESIIKKW